jgi:hypothetical protein
VIVYYSNGIALSWPPQPAGASLWSAGLNVRNELVSVDEAFLALDVDFVASKIIRVFNGVQDEDLITSYIRAATELAQHEMQISIIPQRLALVTSGVPSLGVYELPFGPVREVISYEYYDSANELQTLSGSPAPWMFVNGGRYQPSTLQATYGGSWASVVTRPDAVRITYDAGYATRAEIPQMIKTGIGLVACELYKNPDLSNDMGQIKNVLDVSRFWPRRW